MLAWDTGFRSHPSCWPGAMSCVSLVSELRVSLPVTYALWEINTHFVLTELNCLYVFIVISLLCFLYSAAMHSHPALGWESENLGSRHPLPPVHCYLPSAPGGISVSHVQSEALDKVARGLPPSQCSLEL